MRVFVTWSGETSKALAQILSKWLPAVIQAVEPYFSPNHVAKGSRWSTELAGQLEESRVGIICLTRENLDAPWVLFEAGALSKSLSSSRVCPLLFGVDPAELRGPLAQFQAARFDGEDMRRLLDMINEELGDARLSADLLHSAFDKWWPELESRVSDLLTHAQQPEHPPLPPDAKLLDRLTALRRSVDRGDLTVHADPDLTEDFARIIRALTAAWDGARGAGARDVLEALNSLDVAVADLLTKLSRHVRATELERRARGVGSP